MRIYEKIRDIDRRIIFLLMTLAVSIPIIFQIPFPEVTTPMVKKVFDQIETMPAGSKVLVAFDYDPASEPELQPMANSLVRHLALRGCKLYFIALWPVGQNMIEDTVSNILVPEFGEYVYGVDYVNLGFKSGNEGVIKVIQTNLRKLYTTDGRGASVDKIQMLEGVTSLRNMRLIVNVSAGYPGLKEWVQYGSDPAGVPIVGGCTAVQAPLLYPYYPSQLLGLMGGIKGAAEYDEILKKHYGDQVMARYAKALETSFSNDLENLKASYTGPELEKRTAEAKAKYEEKLQRGQNDVYLGLLRMGPQAIAHLVIILLIVIGNITFFVDRSRQKKLSAYQTRSP
jgi:hypothetical protein